MPEIWFYIIFLVASYLAFAMLALCLPRHQRQLGREFLVMSYTRIRLLASLILLSAFGLAILHAGPAFGTLLAVMGSGLCIILLALTLSWQPQWLSPIVPVIQGLSKTPDND